MFSFEFSAAPLDTAALARELADPTCGAYAAFEGWVRDHNDGLSVTRLDYEAFEPLAVKEGERILEEARQRFGVARARCVHRVGALAVGELAVWVGVSAAHRDEAFRACRYVIDEVKHRLPIWKKEHYRSGDSGWVNCERCAAAAAQPLGASDGRADHDGHAHTGHAHGAQAQGGGTPGAPAPGAQPQDAHHSDAQPTPASLSPDYSRQMALAAVGEQGQAKLRAAAVLVVGAGGLGVPVLAYLAGAGVGRLGIVDGDRLEPSNLHRQILYALGDCGKPKAQLAAERIRALNPQVRTEVFAERLDADSAERLVGDYPLIVDCSDNFATKFLLNDVAQRLGRTLVLSSVYQYEGQLQVVRGDGKSPCLRCIWPEATRDGLVGNCAQAGVLGPVPGVFGALEALETLKILLDLPGQLGEELLVLDLTTFAVNRLRARRSPDCAARPCVRAQLDAATPRDGARLEVSFPSLEAALALGYEILDVREPTEVAALPTPARRVHHLPVAELLKDSTVLDRERRWLVVCARGGRSLAVARELRARGFMRTESLRGGVQGLA